MKEAQEVTPEETRPGTPLERAIFTDFKLSFRLSMGHYGLQQRLQILATEGYHDLNTDPESFMDTLSAVEEKIKGIPVPKVHTDVIPDRFAIPNKNRPLMKKDIDDQLSARWREFSHVLRRLVGPTPPRYPQADLKALFLQYQQNRDEFVIDTIKTFFERDAKYVREGRPNRNQGMDPYESFARNYIVLDIPTGSPRYDAIYDTARELCGFGNPEQSLEPKLPEPLQPCFSDLQLHWSQRHPGEEFLPKAA